MSGGNGDDSLWGDEGSPNNDYPSQLGMEQGGNRDDEHNVYNGDGNAAHDPAAADTAPAGMHATGADGNGAINLCGYRMFNQRDAFVPCSCFERPSLRAERHVR